MTISRDAWNEFVLKFCKHIKPYRNADKQKALDEIMKKRKIQLLCDDVLAKLRTTSTGYINPITGFYERKTCRKFVETFVSSYLSDLHNLPDLETVVMSMDPNGRRRDEKFATSMGRIRPHKEGAPEKATIPPGQSRFFEDDKEMPADIDLIFNTFEAKSALYEYMTEYFESEYFKKDIPEGKTFIFSGAMKVARQENQSPFYDKIVHLPPLCVTKTGHRYMDEVKSDHISEGDLDVWRWVVEVYPTKSSLVVSNDCDVLLVGLLQMRHIVARTSQREVWFMTRRSIGSVEQTEETLQKKESLKAMKSIAYVTTLESTGSIDEAYRASDGLVPPASVLTYSSSSNTYGVSDDLMYDDLLPSSSSDGSRKRTRAPDWADHYIDMRGVYDAIIDEAFELVKGRHVPIKNPVEVYVLIFLLSSDKCDYIQTALASPKISAAFIWKAFKPNLWRIGDIVSLHRPRLQENGADETNEALEDTEIVEAGHSNTITFHHFVINMDSLRTLVECAYMQKAYEALGISKKNNTEEKLQRAREEKCKTMLKAYVTEDNLQIVAAQSVWALQYLANGIFSTYEIVSGLLVDENGNSVYGFKERGWADRVSHTDLKICPPIL